jgi:hypothetical protein
MLIGWSGCSWAFEMCFGPLMQRSVTLGRPAIARPPRRRTWRSDIAVS